MTQKVHLVSLAPWFPAHGAANCSAAKGRPLLSFKGRSISIRCIADIWAQNRSIPSMKSSATVTNAEISREPKQPKRFEKKKNMFGPPRSSNANQPIPGALANTSQALLCHSTTSVPMSCSEDWCSKPRPACRDCPIAVGDVCAPEFMFGLCSIIELPECGSRTSRQASPLPLP
ncbi:hypothetical protein [Bradyrhizobium hipponense]|uniref:hypothetical protein n=1 Tax=Bradyrhizobium hipponense TaxID=2605638 RepID=UPI001652EEF7|nr:hypothetical protein [Bradyrhizobium hipponense]